MSLGGRAQGWPLASSRQPLWCVAGADRLSCRWICRCLVFDPSAPLISKHPLSPAQRSAVWGEQEPKEGELQPLPAVQLLASPGRVTGTCRRQMLAQHPQGRDWGSEHHHHPAPVLCHLVIDLSHPRAAGCLATEPLGEPNPGQRHLCSHSKCQL